MGGIAGAATDAYGATLAANAALTGFNYGQSSPLGGSMAANGAGANNLLSQFLGNSPSTPASTTAYQNYLQQSGFNTQLANSQMGVVNQAAANGTYNSGGTIRAADQNATSMASTAATNYTNYLQGLSNEGQAGLNAVTAAGTGGGAAASNAYQQAGNAAGQAAAGGINTLFGLL